MPERASDKYIPLYFVAFFAVIFAVNAVFVYTAVSTYTGVVTEDAYEEGRDYNWTIAAEEQQEKLGWHSDVVIDKGELKFKISDKNGQAIHGAKIVALISRPMQAGLEQKLKLLETNKSYYSAEVKFPMQGQWQIEVLVKWKGQKYQQSKRVIVQ